MERILTHHTITFRGEGQEAVRGWRHFEPGPLGFAGFKDTYY